MAGYTVNQRGGFLSIGLSNTGFGICSKAWRLGLGLGPSDPSLDYSKARDIRRHENSSWCRWRTMVASMLVWPNDLVEIMVNVVMMCSLCWPSDTGWIAVKLGFY